MSALSKLRILTRYTNPLIAQEETNKPQQHVHILCDHLGDVTWMTSWTKESNSANTSPPQKKTTQLLTITRPRRRRLTSASCQSTSPTFQAKPQSMHSTRSPTRTDWSDAPDPTCLSDNLTQRTAYTPFSGHQQNRVPPCPAARSSSHLPYGRTTIARQRILASARPRPRAPREHLPPPLSRQ